MTYLQCQGPFRTETGDGEKIIFPNSYAEAFRNIPALNFGDSLAEVSGTDHSTNLRQIETDGHARH